MQRAWNRIQRLVDANVRHRRKNFHLQDATPELIFQHAEDELKELREAPDDADEMADLLAILLHYCFVKGWTIPELEHRIIQKLEQRFTDPAEGAAVVTLSLRERAAILAGLRHLQSGGANSIDDIITDGGTLNRLNAKEIDELCERIN
jgi:hypothetical protein